jgi:hypothetical protein
MKNLYHKFLIVSTIGIFIGGVYLYVSKDLNSEGMVPVAFGSSLLSSTTTTDSSVPLDDKVASDISFLTTLASLKNIKIDTSIFTNDSFKSLQDNSVKIESVVPGRLNPFSPVSNTYVNSNSNPGLNLTTSNVVTDPPSQITDQSATLNGTVNTTSKIKDAYFEYGTTQSLGTTTSTVKLSLVGTFIKNVSGLTSQTTYFSRSCAKINNIASCGEIVSFITN